MQDGVSLSHQIACICNADLCRSSLGNRVARHVTTLGEVLGWRNELDIRERGEKPQSDIRRACRVCGCTENNACVRGCWWVEEDLCSACVDWDADVFAGPLAALKRSAVRNCHVYRTVEIPAREEHGGFDRTTVTLPWVCPQCGGPRGDPYRTISYDGSRRLYNADGWRNPCGHIDSYANVPARKPRHWQMP